MNPIQELLKYLVEEPINSLKVILFFVVIFLLYQGLQESSLAKNDYTDASLKTGWEATINLFNGWIIAGSIGFLVLLGIAVFWVYDNYFS